MKFCSLLTICFLLCCFSCKKDRNCPDCLNGGKCIEGTTCDCPPGYSGPRCEVRDSCYGLDCKNGSTCKGDSCACFPTFYGKNCENNSLHNKKYVVKNINLIQDYAGGLCRLDYVNYVKLHDTLLASVTIQSEQIKIILFNSNFNYEYSTVSNGYFSGSYNRKFECGFVDSYTGTYNNGDSVHIVINTYYQTANKYIDVATYDLIKVQ